MKNAKSGFFISLIVISTIPVFGQGTKSYLDTIFLNIDNKTEVTIATYDYNEVKDTLLHNLQSLQQLLAQDKASIEKSVNTDIVFHPNKSLVITRFDPIQKIVFQNGNQFKFLVNAKCSIIGDQYTLTILLNDITELFGENLVKEISHTLTDLPEKNRLAFTYNYSVHSGLLIHHKEFDNLNGMRDYLEIDFGIGANLIKNKPVTDINARVVLGFSNKGIYKNRFYSSANFQFMFNEEANVNLNTFLNLGYKRNFSNNISKDEWFGVELGYLVNRNGDFYQGNTYRLGVSWEITKGINVCPQVYLEDGNKFYPTLRFTFGF